MPSNIKNSQGKFLRWASENRIELSKLFTYYENEIKLLHIATFFTNSAVGQIHDCSFLVDELVLKVGGANKRSWGQKYSIGLNLGGGNFP